MNNRFAVIGLGRFGLAVAESLRGRASLLVCDRNAALVDAVGDRFDHAIVCDTSDEAAFREAGLDSVGTAVVAIGADALEASILTTELLRQARVPRIVARANTAVHARVLRAVGAHETVNPEADMGARIAQRLVAPNLLEALEFGEDTEVAQLAVPRQLVGQTLETGGVRRTYGLTVLVVRRDGQTLNNPSAQLVLQSGDVLIVLGKPQDVRAFASLV